MYPNQNQPGGPVIQVQHGQDNGFNRPPEAFVSEDVSESSVLDDLRAELAVDPEIDDTVVMVPMRPNISLVFSKEIDWDVIQGARKRAGAKGDDTTNFDQMKFVVAVMSHANKDILLKGRSTGKKIMSVDFHQMMGVATGSTRFALEKLFKLNGHLLIAGGKVLQEAGYDPKSLDLMDADDTPLDE